jgi:hypothetical protein
MEWSSPTCTARLAWPSGSQDSRSLAVAGLGDAAPAPAGSSCNVARPGTLAGARQRWLLAVAHDFTSRQSDAARAHEYTNVFT